MEISEIAKRFENANNTYFGHGIGATNDNKETIDSIIKQGVRTREKQLYFTSNILGIGSPSLLNDNLEQLNNWPHREAKKIMIISVPTRWRILEFGVTTGMADRPFYKYLFQGQEQDKNTHPGGAFYVRPEFILGMYDAETGEFDDNQSYYENLPREEQDKLFAEVKQKYIEALQETVITLKEYSEIIESLGMEVPLTPEEIQQADRKDVLNEYTSPIIQNANQARQQETETEMLTLPNGVKIPRKQYEEEMGTEKNQVEMVTLPNGVKIPRKQYEEEMRTSKKIMWQSISTAVSTAKVTRAEAKKQTADIADTKRMKKLMFKEKSGGILTDEEKAFMELMSRLTTETQIRYRNQQAQKKNKGQGLEI